MERIHLLFASTQYLVLGYFDFIASIVLMDELGTLLESDGGGSGGLEFVHQKSRESKGNMADFFCLKPIILKFIIFSSELNIRDQLIG